MFSSSTTWHRPCSKLEADFVYFVRPGQDWTLQHCIVFLNCCRTILKYHCIGNLEDHCQSWEGGLMLESIIARLFFLFISQLFLSFGCTHYNATLSKRSYSNSIGTTWFRDQTLKEIKTCFLYLCLKVLVPQPHPPTFFKHNFVTKVGSYLEGLMCEILIFKMATFSYCTKQHKGKSQRGD